MSINIDDLRINRSRIDRPRLRNRMKATFVCIAIAVLTIALTLALTVLRHKPIPVEIIVAQDEYAPSSGVILSASGYVVPHHRINVNSKVTGRVSWIGVEKGDRVTKGQLLVKLEDQEFLAQVEEAKGTVDTAKASLAELQAGSRPEEIERTLHDLGEAKATLQNNKTILDRTEKLFAEHIESLQQLQDAQANYRSTLERFNSLEQTYHLAKIGPRLEEIAKAQGTLAEDEGHLAYTESQLNATEIRAPVDGTILERTAEKGELVTAQFASGLDTGGPRGSVVELADLSDLQVEADISQDELSLLDVNPKAIVYTDAFPDRKYSGKIAEISPEGDRQKGTVSVRVQILRPDSYLRPEMNAKVDFVDVSGNLPARMAGGVYLPSTTLAVRNARNVVFVVRDGQIFQHDVKLLKRRSEGWIMAGIVAGDEVVNKPSNSLHSGESVRIAAQN